MKRVIFGALAAMLAVTAFSSATKAGGALTIFDMDYVFQCSKLKEGSPQDKPEYESYLGIYAASKKVRAAVCTFDGALGEKWHPLFPEHPAERDQSCAIAYRNQKSGNSISFF